MGLKISFPVQRFPTSFEKVTNFTAMGENKDKHVTTGDQPLNLFEEITEQFFSSLLEKRKEIILARRKFHDVDMTTLNKLYPQWTYDDIQDLKVQFQTFDINQDGLIDFKELCNVLDELGDISGEAVRKRYFQELDVDGSGAVDFEEYLMLVNQMYKTKGETDKLKQICKKGSESAQKFRRLSVVQQISNGLF